MINTTTNDSIEFSHLGPDFNPLFICKLFSFQDESMYFYRNVLGIISCLNIFIYLSKTVPDYCCIQKFFLRVGKGGLDSKTHR